MSKKEIENGTYEERKISENEIIRETQATYLAKKQGEFTLEDYYALPDDVRMELIDGYLYTMDAPSFAHQKIIMEIAYIIKSYIVKNRGKCEVVPSPLDVQLDCDDKTMLQPDVVIICDRNKIEKRCIFGAPEFVVEILSPSTSRKDMTIKLSKYLNAGVREYWIVDPDRKKIIVYNWEQEEILAVYGFDGKVPVGIFEGKCEVDFAKIYEEIAYLYE